jgi:bifunctional DNase/RNase
MIEVVIHSLGMEQETNQPVIILRATADDRMLPIWIGGPEAQAILMNFQDVPPPRPMTHDLLHNTIRALGFLVERVEITDLQESTFFANIVLFDGTNTVELDARPSDSIALAVRAGCPILVDEGVMETASREWAPEDELETEEAEREVEQFREFLAGVDPEDFAGNS